MKKFNKLDFLTLLGLVDRKFNYETGRFEKSTGTFFKACFVFLIRITFCLRLIFSAFFEREDSIQLIIGLVDLNFRF